MNLVLATGDAETSICWRIFIISSFILYIWDEKGHKTREEIKRLGLNACESMIRVFLDWWFCFALFFSI
jgi:hypothetical protein